jgi:hypothetical protein
LAAAAQTVTRSMGRSVPVIASWTMVIPPLTGSPSSA